MHSSLRLKCDLEWKTARSALIYLRSLRFSIDGHTRGIIRQHLRAADHFGAWLLKQGMGVTDISTSTRSVAILPDLRLFAPSGSHGIAQTELSAR
jgi:hypothetical protein